ncbi:amidase signature enzyme [Morchella conica CCBAS932]|uniref:Glutamyl-tRNA(Gln) amidotransferase subunit A, mitochondrial n=1 Tax=Morchella conica CCBAS932 TaxID=1392247 RepID=A0A3N4L657_9PEZI|nr:amidase signature enzyme [Morchella conica CCBAS932]
MVLVQKKSEHSSSSSSSIDGRIIAVKDNICTTDLPTTCASEMLRDYVSPYEATVVQNLKRAGAIIMGKTNMDEFGMGSHSIYSAFGAVVGPSPPEDPQPRSAGGSSGGSAVAVAMGMCDAALGTDTGGSVRLPASYCGVVGFKPSYGMLSRLGVVAYANSLDTVGILGKDHDPRDPTSLSPETRKRLRENLSKSSYNKASLRIGIPTEYNVTELTPAVREAWETTAQTLLSLGHRITPISLPHTPHSLSSYYVLAPAEASSNLAKYDGVRYGHRSAADRSSPDNILFAPTRHDGFGAEVRRRILMGAYALSSEAKENYFIQAQRVRALVQSDFDAAFVQPNWLKMRHKDKRAPPRDGGQGRVDVILAPCALSAAPLLSDVRAQRSPLDAYVNDVLTVPASLAGVPAVSVPVWVEGGRNPEGRPIGMQVMTQFGDEGVLWEAAKILEGLGTMKACEGR